GVKVEHDLVALPLRLVVDLPRARVHRLGLLRQLADDFLPEVIAERVLRFLPRGGRREVGLCEKLLPPVIAESPKSLRVSDELLELTHLPGGWVEVLPAIGGHGRRFGETGHAELLEEHSDDDPIAELAFKGGNRVPIETIARVLFGHDHVRTG